MRLFESLVVALLVSTCAVPAFADGLSNPGSGNRGFTLAVGYDVSHLDYAETLPGFTDVIDKDSGWMNGVNAEARFETKDLWTRVTFDYSGTNNAKYDGALQDGTPVHMSTKEWITRYEGNIGYKLFDEGHTTFTPYLGIGYRSWERGEDVLPDYMEKYTWWYGAFGINYVWRHNRLTVGADAAIMWPFDMKMKTNVAGLFDEATFKIKSRPGFKAELPITFALYRAEESSHGFFAFVTPYYQYWGVRASDDVLLTSGGVPVALAFEPDSTTDIFGANIGLGVNF